MASVDNGGRAMIANQSNKEGEIIMFTWSKDRQLKCGYIPNGEIVEVHFRINVYNNDR